MFVSIRYLHKNQFPAIWGVTCMASYAANEESCSQFNLFEHIGTR